MRTTESRDKSVTWLAKRTSCTASIGGGSQCSTGLLRDSILFRTSEKHQDSGAVLAIMWLSNTNNK
jgi:hypothetical protein